MHKEDPNLVLTRAFARNELTVFVGAGASTGSGIPNWRELVENVFLNSLASRTGIFGLAPTHDQNGVHMVRATAESWFARSTLPLEVVTRGLRSSFARPEEFLKWVRFGLYQRFGSDRPTEAARWACRRNPTLQAIAKLCKKTRPGKIGLRSAVNYNLDGLLELTLGNFPFQAIWKPTPADPEQLQIYHVHGFLPIRDSSAKLDPRAGSSPQDIVLTEDQYQREAADPYSWANLVQLQAMSGSVGLAIGLSISDPNLRRLLQVTRRAPFRPRIFAFLQKPEVVQFDEKWSPSIVREAERIRDMFHRHYRTDAPLPMNATLCGQVARKAWAALERASFKRHVALLRELGVTPVWCDFVEIPALVDKIVGNKSSKPDRRFVQSKSRRVAAS